MSVHSSSSPLSFWAVKRETGRSAMPVEAQPATSTVSDRQNAIKSEVENWVGKKEQKKGGFAPREGITAKLECNFARLRKLAPFSLTHFTAAPFFRQRCISLAVAVRTTIIAFFTESPINNLVWEASPLLFPLNSSPPVFLSLGGMDTTNLDGRRDALREREGEGERERERERESAVVFQGCLFLLRLSSVRDP